MPGILTSKLLPERRYDTAQDVSMRLKDTIVSYNGEPCFVRQAGMISDNDPVGLHVCLHNLRTMDNYVVHSSDELLDVQSLPLGWVFTVNHRPCFLSRTTRSSQRQGVHLPSLLVLNENHGIHMGFGWHDWADLKCLVPMFSDQVQSIQWATKQPLGAPLSREWALLHSNPEGSNKNYFKIYHQSIQVGTYIVKSREFFFTRGRLTKTRKVQLQEIFNHPSNTGVRYAVSEQI